MLLNNSTFCKLCNIPVENFAREFFSDSFLDYMLFSVTAECLTKMVKLFLNYANISERRCCYLLYWTSLKLLEDYDYLLVLLQYAYI